MFEKLENCPCCGSIDFVNYIICKDHTASNESFVLCRCPNCELIFTNPRPTKENIHTYYESQDYISHSNKTSSLTDILYKIVRNHTIRKKLSLINKYSGTKTLLDYGCGTGHFIKKAFDHGWKVSGIEPNDHARVQASRKVGADVVSDLTNLQTQRVFSVITLWHVLEHVHELNKTISQLKAHLHKSGRMIVAVPNPNSWDAQHYKEYWAAYDVPRHLYHFTQSSMKSLVSKHGLKIDDLIPMTFDSFYVSLLSERYKNGSTNYLKSFINGYKSNSYAKNNLEFSSLIYVLRKK